MASRDGSMTKSTRLSFIPARHLLAGTAPRTGSVGPHIRGLGLKLIGRSVAESSQCNYASGFRSWCVFRRLIISDKFLRRDASPEEMSWALIDFAARCFESKGNLAGTISRKFAAVQYYHRVEAQVEIIATSPLVRCALKGIARSHVEAGTRHRVRFPVTWRMWLDGESLILAWAIGGRVIWLCLSLSYFLIARSDEIFAVVQG